MPPGVESLTAAVQPIWPVIVRRLVAVYDGRTKNSDADDLPVTVMPVDETVTTLAVPPTLIVIFEFAVTVTFVLPAINGRLPPPEALIPWAGLSVSDREEPEFVMVKIAPSGSLIVTCAAPEPAVVNVTMFAEPLALRFIPVEVKAMFELALAVPNSVLAVTFVENTLCHLNVALPRL